MHQEFAFDRTADEAVVGGCAAGGLGGDGTIAINELLAGVDGAGCPGPAAEQPGRRTACAAGAKPL